MEVFHLTYKVEEKKKYFSYSHWYNMSMLVIAEMKDEGFQKSIKKTNKKTRGGEVGNTY